jgi:CTD small phosphatase-like protein 2
MPGLGADESDDNRSSSDYQSCDVSDFYISDMIVASLPYNGNAFDDDSSGANCFPDYKCAEPSLLFDVAEQYMMLPFLEDTVKTSDINHAKSCEEAMLGSDNTSLYLAIDQMRPCNQEFDANSDSDQGECFDPQVFIKNLPELSDVVSNFQPAILPEETQNRKHVTLVLDLDGMEIESYIFVPLPLCYLAFV